MVGRTWTAGTCQTCNLKALLSINRSAWFDGDSQWRNRAMVMRYCHIS